MTGQLSFTHDEAIAAATRFDVIVAQPKALAAYVADMHVANPSLRILAYVNGAYTKTTTFPESYYTHDSAGTRVRWITFDTWQLELSNPAARGTVAAEYRAALTLASYDGVLLDNVGLTSINATDKSGLPIDPTTSLTYTASGWMAQTTALVHEVHATFPQALVIGNGLAWGKPYFDPLAATSVLTENGTSGEAEQFVRSATQAVATFHRESDWKKDVDMLIDSEQHGAPLAAVTKVWVTATAAQIETWHRYALATFLLGDDGTSFFAFLGDRSLGTATADSSLEHTRIGTPNTAYSKTGGAYQRTFTNGLVMVNPTTAAVNVPITGTYTNLNGATVTGTVRLAPQTGEILTLG